jgi:hypothetical protein
MTEGEALRVLHLDPDCSREQIRQAYTDLVKVWHPDRFQADARLRQKADDTLRLINAAYEVLQRRGAAEEASPASPSEQQSAEPEPSTGRESLIPPPRPAWFKRRALRAATIGAVVGVALAVAIAWRESPAPEPVAVGASPLPAADAASSVDRQPRTPQPDSDRPESGSDLSAAAHHGTGWLSTRNGSRYDAVVLLDREAQTERVFFVRSGEQVTLLDLMPGTYRVRVILGDGWAGRAFQRPVGHFEREASTRVAAHVPSTRPVALVIDDRNGLRPIPAFALD